MSASSIKMGGVFVEIGADARKFFTALNRVNKSLANMGKGLVSGGAKLGAAGIGMAAPIAAAVKQGANFESVLLGIRASTGMAAAEVDKVKAAALGMSQALGVGPTAAAQGMLELLKAGVPVEKVLGGVGQAALQFAKVGEMDVAQAAVVMSDAMNVFGVSGTKAADTLSAAADASSTSITQMAEAFSMSSAVAGLANQDIDDLSAALALLANAGVKGSDAGTSIKTMLMRLMAPAEDGAKALADIGLATDSFRGADGKMKPLVEILGTLNGALGGLDQTAKDDVFRRIFGADAIRAASILSSAGVDGFQGMRDAMSQALPVGEKFKTLMSGMAGGGLRVLASLERLSIVIADALNPAIGKLVPLITGAIDGFADFAAKNKEAVTLYAQVAAAAIGIGGAMVGLGYALQVVATGFGGIGKAAGVALLPLQAGASVVGGLSRFGVVASKDLATLASVVSRQTVSAMTGLTAAVGGAAARVAALGAAASGQAAAGMASLAASATRLGASGVSAANQMFPAFAVGFGRGRSSGAGFFSSMIRGFRGVAMSSSVMRGVFSSISGSAIGNFAKDIAGGLAFTYKSFVWWASGVTAKLSQYAVNLTGAVGKTVVSTASMSAAWIANGLRGVTTFVGGAVAGIATYLGACASAVAGSVAAAARMAAAWLAPLAPFALLAAAIGGAGALIYAFRGQIATAFSGVSEIVGQAAGAIGTAFMGAVSDAIAVFGDLYQTASSTFTGIYDAIVAGDLASAMDILWAGLVAGWLRGVEAIMSYVDPWIASFQDAFTIMGGEIYKGFDALWVSVAGVLNNAGAVLMGVMDNIINGILASWDFLEASIRKAWIRVSGIFKSGEDKKRELDAVDADMKGRAAQREKNRPGVKGRLDKAAQQNADAERGMIRRRDAIDAATQETIAGREAANASRAQDRRQGVIGAEARLADLTSGAAMKRADMESLPGIQDALASVKSVSELGAIGQQISGLLDRDTLTADQEAKALEAYRAAQSRLASEVAGGSGGKDKPPEVNTESMGKIAGTFSSLNLGATFGGTSVAERTAKAAEETAKGVKELVGQGGGKVAA